MTATTTAMQPRPGALAPGIEFLRLPALPWRDPHSVPAGELAKVIASLSEACAHNPANADLRVCLGIAHAMNHVVYSSLVALVEARALEPRNFFAQFNIAELKFRLLAM